MTVFKKHTELRLASGVKAFLNLDAGVVRGEVAEAVPEPPPEENAEVGKLREKLEKKDRELAEMRNEVEGGPPIPPPEEIHLVTGAKDTTWFIESGRAHVRIFRELLEKNGLDIESFDSLLDFGCGCGRMVRHWNTLEDTEVHGTDYNPRLVSWCEENLDFASFEVNELEGRLGYEDGKFDFVYALSVFTHLTEAQCFHWIKELSRALRPGGISSSQPTGSVSWSSFPRRMSNGTAAGSL